MKLDLIGKSFGTRAILGPLRLEIRRGQRIAILGPSGAGKSTLLRIIAGLDCDFTGQLSGKDRIAIAFQEPTLLPWRTALANITIPTGCTVATALDLLTQVGLLGHQTKFPRQLSLGQQRRLSLARAFAAKPDLLLMDEPFASLDTDTAAQMTALTANLLDQTGAGLLLVTHNPSEPTRLGARTRTLSGNPASLN